MLKIPRYILRKISGKTNQQSSVSSGFTSYMQNEITQILGGQKLVIVDVGGAVNLQPHFHKILGNATYLVFEPDERSYKDLIASVGRYAFPEDFNYINTALSGADGKRTLYLTNVPTGSSILKLKNESPFYSKESKYFFPMIETEIETRSIESILNERSITYFDAIKLDVQGAELEILKGIDDARFDEINSVEMEIGLHSVYIDQTTFCEVLSFMESKGFGLFELRVNRTNIPSNVDNMSYHKEYFNVHEQSPSIASRVWEFDAIFFREPHWIKSNNIDKSRTVRIIALYCMYNFFAEAIQIASQAVSRRIITDQEFTKLKNAIIEANKAEQQVVKNIEEDLKSNNYVVWAQYMSVPYPSN